MKKAVVVLGIAVLFGFSSAQQRVLTVITHDSFNLSKDVVAAFEAKENIKLAFVKGGDAGAMTNKLILTKSNPIADVVFGIDNSLMAKALQADILESYRPKMAAALEKFSILDAKWRISPVNYGFVCLNYDLAWFEKAKLALPKSLEDLTKPAYKSLLVVQNPATSSPGLAFYFATLKFFGERKALEFWAGLKTNDVKVAAGWEAAYYSDFSRNGGTRPIVVSYSSSPAAEVFYGDGKTATTANLLLPGSSFLQIEGVAVLRGTKNSDLAHKFIDFMLEPRTQADIPTNMWVYPAIKGIALPDVFSFAIRPKETQISSFSANIMAVNQQRWIEAWTRVVLQKR